MIVVFDFDKTLTQNDTILGFYGFASSKNLIFYLKLLIYYCLVILSKLGFFSNTSLKKIGVFLFLKNKNKEYLLKKGKMYMKIIPYNEEILKKLVNHLDSGDDVYIVTASFCEYVQFFPVNSVKICCSSLRYNHNKVDSLEFNCFGENKVLLLREKFGVSKIDLLYTDSKSDSSLIEISAKTVWVKK